MGVTSTKKGGVDKKGVTGRTSLKDTSGDKKNDKGGKQSSVGGGRVGERLVFQWRGGVTGQRITKGKTKREGGPEVWWDT